MAYNRKNDEIINHKSCRICIDSKCKKFVDLDGKGEWLKVFKFCFDLELLNIDQPRTICQSCAINVKKYAAFKEKCHKSHEFWRSASDIRKLYTEKPILGYKIDEEEKEDFNDDVDTEQTNNKIILLEEEDFKLLQNNENDVNMFDVNLHGNIKIENEYDLVDTENNCELQKTDKENKTEPVDTVGHFESDDNTQINIDSLFTHAVALMPKTFCRRCERSYASESWYRKHLKTCKSKKKKRTVNRNTPLKSGSEKNPKKNVCKNKIPSDIPHANFCGVCTYSTESIKDLNEHLQQHWTKNDLQCLMCEFVAKDQAAILAHRYTHYALTVTSFQCHICLRKSLSQLSLQFHYRKVHLNKSGGLCSQPNCDKVYDIFRLWKRHERVHNHPGFICDYCGKKYPYKHQLVEHITRHETPLSNVCDVCGKTFCRLRNLKLHYKNIHTKQESIKCTHCEKTFKNEYYMKQHLRIEAMEKKWKCEFCPMEYALLSALQCHLKGHSDERPCCCHICGARYKRKSQLRVHMRVHTGARPFQCTACPKAFASSNQLKSHSITHTGIMPYKCVHCQKAFRCKQRMLKCVISHDVK